MRRVLKLFGPPGTGKTFTLLRIVEKAIKSGVPIGRIAYITFTVRAQREALLRAAKQLDTSIKELPYFRTLHSIAYRQLGVSSSQLVRGAEDLETLGKALHLRFTGTSFSMAPEHVGANDGDAFIAFDHFRRHTGLSVEKAWQKWVLESDATMFQVRQFVTEYERYKKLEGLLDFTDLLEKELQPLDVDVLIVDEAQDLSALQWRALRRLAGKAKRIYLAGDDDQAIYTWAGASPDEFLNARADRVQVLKQSFRVPRRVQALANGIIGHVKLRQEKVWRSRDDDGSVRFAPDLDSLSASVASTTTDTLILYRNHCFGLAVEEMLRSAGVPYSYADPERQPAARRWIPAILSWHRLQKPEGRVSTKEARELVAAIAMGRGVSAEARSSLSGSPSGSTWSLEQLRMIGLSSTGTWFEALTKVNNPDAQYIRAILRHHGNDGLLKTPRIRISTIHAAKGAQADHVIMLTDMTRRVERGIYESPDDERRVWYVGATRAKQALTIVGQTHPFLLSPQ
jgi:DNA helicase-2/ATP-dependent DNA helicase PcrA